MQNKPNSEDMSMLDLNDIKVTDISGDEVILSCVGLDIERMSALRDGLIKMWPEKSFIIIDKDVNRISEIELNSLGYFKIKNDD